jgi:GNAT superfamily N-acetyltransferase
MFQRQTASETEANILIKPFEWQDWYAMWKLNAYHLAESGIIDDTIQGPPDFSLPYDETDPRYPEMDMERIEEAYLKARGNFWIAWIVDLPVGHIGAQDRGDYIELRRMYVRSEHRRQGIGTLLVQALIEHCKKHKAGIVKLWTSEDGPGRFLYAKLGFRQVELLGDELSSNYGSRGEIRMRMELAEVSSTIKR